MKKMLAMVMVLVLLPLAAMAGAQDAPLSYERQQKKFIDFPALDGWRGHFSSVTKWTIVTPDTLEENWELVAARGDTEEEIRARYAQPSFLFEAYSPDLPEDACFRAEVFETDYTREVWHLRHWDSAERKAIRNDLMSGAVLTDREVYSLTNFETNLNAYERGYFTNYPPATHESGRVRLHFYNGKLYVFSYCVSGRLAGASRWYTAKEKAAYEKTPVASSEAKFKGEALPRLPEYALTSPLPEMMNPGTITVQGKVEAGSTLEATLDGQPAAVEVDKKGNFTVELPLTENGEHQVVFTVSMKERTTRTMAYTVQVNDGVTPLTITDAPVYAEIGTVTVAGQAAPGAELTFRLDEEEMVTRTADVEGGFSCSFEVTGRGGHTLQVTAQAEGQEASDETIEFTADYADTQDGINAFAAELTDATFKTICSNVEEHIGAKVKISVRTKEITLNEQGLGLLCVYNAKEKKDQTPLYINVPGYAQCQIGENMIITVYATVDGKRVLFDEDGEEDERVELTVEYGTYLVAR